MKHLLILLFIFICFARTHAQSVPPEKGNGSEFSLSFANLYFEVDSARGARISSFQLDGYEILYNDFKTTDNAGSTFWPSPQNSTWGWPPPANLNDKPYSANISGNKITFKGATDSKYQLRFYKTMYADTADTSITIEYVIKNEKSTTQKWAPWEITRVIATGLTIFAKESGNVTGDMAARTIDENGYIWYDQDLYNSPGSKLFCNGKGWIAHVTSDNILLIKKFENITAAKAAPAEAEVEVYTAPDDSYTELEDQGAYTSIPGKDSITWKVKWYARRLPASVDAITGSKSLTNYIESILALDAPSVDLKLNNSTNTVNVFPNPATEKLSIESVFDSYSDVRLRIFNMQGKLKLVRDIVQGKTDIDITELASGNYIYEIRKGTVLVKNGQFSVIR